MLDNHNDYADPGHKVHICLLLYSMALHDIAPFWNDDSVQEERGNFKALLKALGFGEALNVSFLDYQYKQQAQVS